MSLLWPWSLFLLGLIPVIGLAYAWALRRRRRYALRYSSLSLVRLALPRTARLRRHLPFALFLLALASLVVALARPAAEVSVPIGKSTVVLAIDVSRSMCSTDIAPNRLEAARSAAQSFIQRQGANIQIGVVAFSGFSALVQPPTSDQEALQTAVESLTTGRRTAIGSGLLKALETIAEQDASVAPLPKGPDAGPPVKPLPEGTYVPHIVVLLTDGVSNSGPLPLEAAGEAVARGVRVYTIGFGTSSESAPMPDCGAGAQWGGGGSGGGGGGLPRSDNWFGGSGFRRGIDEATLKQIASVTGGSYYSAESAGELQDVFRRLPVFLNTRLETIEISVFFAALGALLAATAVLLSLLWRPLP